jgi:hypothetical protein
MVIADNQNGEKKNTRRTKTNKKKSKKQKAIETPAASERPN